MLAADNYFNLDQSKCRLVKGAVGAALYDFAGGTVMAVPPDLVSLIDTENLGFFLSTGPGAVHHYFFVKLQTAGLGQFAPSASQGAASDESCPDITPDFCWLEVTPACNLRCVHCYGSFGPPEVDPAQQLTLEEWIQILKDVRKAGFEQIQFIGGEPLMCEYLDELLFEARSLGFAYIEVFSNLTMADDFLFNTLLANQVHLATTVYSVNPKVHDRVTGKPGSFELTTVALRKAIRWGIPSRMSCIISSVNEGQVGDVAQLAEEIGAAFGGYDQVRPTGRGNKTTCNSTVPRRHISPHFFTNRRDFAETMFYNPCWKGKVNITADGTVVPCVFARDRVAGNLREETLSEVIDRGLRPYWRFTKDQIETCQDCEFRYACSDCRPLAAGWNDNNLSARTYGCGYDPYSGKWK